LQFCYRKFSNLFDDNKLTTNTTSITIPIVVITTYEEQDQNVQPSSMYNGDNTTIVMANTKSKFSCFVAPKFISCKTH